MNIEITTPTGDIKTIAIGLFPALEGWDIQQRFLEFAATNDKDVRTAYTLEVLTYANVVQTADRTLPLTTAALIDNHLGSWQNVKRVFEEVLIQNGIDPKTHADQPHYWSNAGNEMATAFIAEVSILLGPAFSQIQGVKSE
jgi:hypothetical protein